MIEGLDDLSANIQALIKQVDGDEVESGLLEIAKVLHGRIRARAPIGPRRRKKVEVKMLGFSLGTDMLDVKPGALRKAWRAKKFKTKWPGVPAVFVAPHYKLAPHAHLVEYGHGGPHPAPPHPYARPEVDAFKSEYPRLVAKMLREKFGKVVGPTAQQIFEAM
ncbi:MAG: HK97 gp10 family phage protein [Syntrophales bacterium]|nr:HK97 gp10 family phage protein [Syntrophales bacterium]